jgi:peptidoglycan/xylan/chitin deacetylase (PgdA/CDA1 family)
MRAISLGYHNISDAEACPRIAELPQVAHYAVTRSKFRAQLDAMDRRHALCPSLMQAGSRWSEPSPLLITFDDGLLGAYSHAAPELERLGWRGHFFITTDWMNRPGFMRREQIRDLHARGHVIGSHTCSHPQRMSKLSRGQLLHEWRESCQALGDLLGVRIETASVPNGYCSRAVTQAAAPAGIRVLFNSDPVTRVHEVDDCLVLGRYAVYHDSSSDRVARIAAGEQTPRLQQLIAWRTRAAAKQVLGRSYFFLRNHLLPDPTNR